MTSLWSAAPAPLSSTPFEHVCIDDFLPSALFAELASTFPDCPPASGPTGFTIHPGDPAFVQLMARQPAWRGLWQACDGQAFVDHALRQFRRCFATDCVVDLGAARHVHYVESRVDKESRRLACVEHAPDRLWVRFDLMQGRVGYARPVHVDHRRRAATMLIYFTDGGGTQDRGGDLLLHPGRRRPATVRITPRANRMVMFACCNASWHSVSRIACQAQPRNVVQVTVSSSVDLWPAMAPGAATRLREAVRALWPRRAA